MDDRTYHDRVVRLSELAGDEGVLDGFTFIGCHLKGPVVVVPRDCAFAHTTFQGHPDALLWEIPESRSSIIGALLVTGCTFERCTFEAVGFAGGPEFARQFRAALPDPSSN